MPNNFLIEAGILPTPNSQFKKTAFVAEDWQTINLIWYDDDGNRYEFVFGKRAAFYYKCDLKCYCFWRAHRKFFLDSEKIFSWGKKARHNYINKTNWDQLFDDIDYNGRETVVVEEKEGRINLFSKLKPDQGSSGNLPKTGLSGNPFKSKLSFVIEDESGVECPRPRHKQKRPCCEHPRISYVTYRPPSLFGLKCLSVSNFEENSLLNKAKSVTK